MGSPENNLFGEELILFKTSGEYVRYKELLRSRLYESGWVDQIHKLCQQARKNKLTTINELYDDVTPKGRDLVPITVKKELLMKVKENLLQKAGYYERGGVGGGGEVERDLFILSS